MKTDKIPNPVIAQLPIALTNDQLPLINNLLTTFGSNWIDSEFPDDSLQYALSIAALHSSIEIFTLLINTGACVDVRDTAGRTPLINAITQNKIQHVELLLAQGANLILPSKTHWTPLYIAANKNYLEIAQLLVSSENASAEMINFPNTVGGTALMVASMQGYTEIINLLLDNGADINQQDHNKWNALMKAAHKGHADVVACLLDRGADYTLTDNNGCTPLIIAAKNGHSATVEILLPLKNSNVNAQDVEGNTALHYAIESNNTELASLLLARDADIHIQNRSNVSPLMLAESKNLDDMLQLLNPPGATIGF